MSISSPVIKIGITATELIADDTLSLAARTVQHTLFDETITPSPATIFSGKLYAMVAGALSLDLRALRTVAGGSGDGNGLKVQGFYFKNLGANIMTIVAGASNGYLIFGTAGSVIVPPGGCICISLADGSADVDATHKTIDVSGTSAQTFECAVILG